MEGKNNINENNIDIYIIIKVKFIFNKLLTSTNSMFLGHSSLQSIDLYSFNTINVKDMSYMFYRCSSLQSIDFSSFNTTNVKDMSNMLFYCPSLEKENVKIGSYCKKILDELDVIQEQLKLNNYLGQYNKLFNKIL